MSAATTAAAASAALARAEAVGLRLRLEGAGRVRWRCRGEPPPAALLAELRRHRDEVVRLLAERQAECHSGSAASVPYAPDGRYASARGADGAAAGRDVFEVGCEVRGIAGSSAGSSAAGAAPSGTAPSWVRAARTASGNAWLGGIAAAVRAALADGAEREADPEGWFVLMRPDGRRSLTAPRTVAELAAAGFLPALPEARETLEAARSARPPSWSDGEDVPLPGDRCRCGGRHWWCEAAAPRGWRCWTCNPPDHLPAGSVRGMRM